MEHLIVNWIPNKQQKKQTKMQLNNKQIGLQRKYLTF